MAVANNGQELKIWKDMESDTSLKYHLGRLTKDELKNIVKNYEIKGVSKLKKDELIDVIITNIVEKANQVIKLENEEAIKLVANVIEEGSVKKFTGDLSIENIISLRDKGILFTGTINKEETLIVPNEIKEVLVFENSVAKECAVDSQELESSNEEISNEQIAKLTRQLEQLERMESQGRMFGVNSDEKQMPIRSHKIGRNELCPCGSGKKYKKCCLGK